MAKILIFCLRLVLIAQAWNNRSAENANKEASISHIIKRQQQYCQAHNEHWTPLEKSKNEAAKAAKSILTLRYSFEG